MRRRHLHNAFFGVLDYAAYPAVMLATAPMTIRLLGPAEYGLWMIAGTVMSIGGILASGFSDVSLQRVSALAATNDMTGAVECVRSMLAITLVLGTLITAAVFIACPFAAVRMQAHSPTLIPSCLAVLRLSALGILLRSVLSLAVSTQRALQRYRSATLINVTLYAASPLAALLLAVAGFHVLAIVTMTLASLTVALIAQWCEARRLLGPQIVRPAFVRPHASHMLRDGSFLWLQTAAAVASDRLDRVLLGLTLGVAAVAPYSLCVQLAQPLCCITASGLSFLFPLLAERAATRSLPEVRKTVAKALAVNGVIIAVGLGCTLLLGRAFLSRWVGETVGREAAHYLLPVALGSACIGASVTGIFALQAVRQFRTLALLSIATRAVMLCVMLLLLRDFGAYGLAVSRLLTGACALLIYIPTWRAFHVRHNEVQPSFATPTAVHEGVKL